MNSLIVKTIKTLTLSDIIRHYQNLSDFSDYPDHLKAFRFEEEAWLPSPDQLEPHQAAAVRSELWSVDTELWLFSLCSLQPGKRLIFAA